MGVERSPQEAMGEPERYVGYWAPLSCPGGKGCSGQSPQLTPTQFLL